MVQGVGLAAAVDVTLFHEIEERTGNGGFVFMAHRQIRIVPTAENAEALEIFFVLLDIAQGELAAELAEFRGRYFAFSAQFLFHLGFDGQAVAIPAGNVGCVMPSHALGFDHEILEDFVEASAKMDFASGIWRAVVQDEERLAIARFQDAFVDVAAVPSLELLGLVLRQAGLHRKIGFRQVQRFLQFEWFGHRL